jgi:hypothetical protein
MGFRVLPNLAGVKGVFQGLYHMSGPYTTKEDAEKVFKSNKMTDAIYVESNKLLYILKEEAKNASTEHDGDTQKEEGVGDISENSPVTQRLLGPTYPKPKPEPEIKQGDWF